MEATALSKEEDERQFKAAFPPPDFEPAASVRYLGTQQDSQGRWLALIQYDRNFMHDPWSARFTVRGALRKSLDLAIRMKWNDEHPAVPEGDLDFITQFRLEKDTRFLPLSDKVQRESNCRSWLGAVVLPFKTDAIRIVDR